MSPIIIDNPNLQAIEAKPYVMIAKEANYRVEIVEPKTNRHDPIELAKYSVSIILKLYSYLFQSNIG